jgi:hypothetical protein
MKIADSPWRSAAAAHLVVLDRRDVATSASIHIDRLSAEDIRFVFFETDRVMGGTCTFLPP